MPYYIYKRTQTDSGSSYRYLRSISLGGDRNGVIFPCLQSQFADREFPFLLSAGNLLETARYAPNEHAIIIQPTPGQTELKLMQLEHVVG